MWVGFLKIFAKELGFSKETPITLPFEQQPSKNSNTKISYNADGTNKNR